MAHNLHIGQKFEDFAAFESAIMRYQNAENVQFYRRDSRSEASLIFSILFFRYFSTKIEGTL